MYTWESSIDHNVDAVLEVNPGLHDVGVPSDGDGLRKGARSGVKLGVEVGAEARVGGETAGLKFGVTLLNGFQMC